MKKILYVFLSLTVVGFIIMNIANAKSEADLFKMASVLEHENIIIHEWSLHAREKVETSQVNAKMAELKTQFPDWDWNITEDEEKWEAKAVSETNKGIEETIRILSASNHSYMVYEVNGKGWNEESKTVLEKVVFRKIDKLFDENPNIFSCIYSDLGDKMNKSLPSYVDSLLNAFQANEMETLNEDSFISTTAYSPLFSETIKGVTEDINLQLGIRTQGLGGKTTLVVGTPIITIEY